MTPEVEVELKKEFPWAVDGSGEDLLAGRKDVNYWILVK